MIWAIERTAFARTSTPSSGEDSVSMKRSHSTR
jgi:hypothetical protein